MWPKASLSQQHQLMLWEHNDLHNNNNNVWPFSFFVLSFFVPHFRPFFPLIFLILSSTWDKVSVDLCVNLQNVAEAFFADKKVNKGSTTQMWSTGHNKRTKRVIISEWKLMRTRRECVLIYFWWGKRKRKTAPLLQTVTTPVFLQTNFKQTLVDSWVVTNVAVQRSLLYSIEW